MMLGDAPLQLKRRLLAHCGSFRDPTVRNTDGVALTEAASAGSTPCTMTAMSPPSPGHHLRRAGAAQALRAPGAVTG
jgi:hypothetical protein